MRWTIISKTIHIKRIFSSTFLYYNSSRRTKVLSSTKWFTGHFCFIYLTLLYNRYSLEFILNFIMIFNISDYFSSYFILNSNYFSEYFGPTILLKIRAQIITNIRVYLFSILCINIKNTGGGTFNGYSTDFKIYRYYMFFLII